MGEILRPDGANSGQNAGSQNARRPCSFKNKLAWTAGTNFYTLLSRIFLFSGYLLNHRICSSKLRALLAGFKRFDCPLGIGPIVTASIVLGSSKVLTLFTLTLQKSGVKIQ